MVRCGAQSTKGINVGKTKRYKYKRITFWAENGVVMVHDDRDGLTTEVPALEFKKRGESFKLETAVEQYFDEANNLSNLASNVDACVDQALRQGDPTNPRVSREMANLSSVRSWNIGATGGKAQVASPRSGARLYTGEIPREGPPRKLILPAGVA